MDPRIRIIEADITMLAVDAVVNAANERMLGGGGVDGAIHRTAGPKLLEVCRGLPEVRAGVRCPTGEARITPGFNLPAKFVIHTVGPVWHGGNSGEAHALARCYRSALSLAAQHEVKTIAFPAISTGAYGFPLDRAAEIAVDEVTRFLATHSSIERVDLVCSGEQARRAFQAALESLP